MLMKREKKACERERKCRSKKKTFLAENHHLRVAQNNFFFLRENEYSTAI